MCIVVLLTLFIILLVGNCFAADVTEPGDSTSLHQPRQIMSGLHLVIIKAKHELTVYQDSSLVKTYPVGLGMNSGDKQAVGDKRTPEGYFYIKYIKDSSAWTHDFKDGKGEIQGAYGPYFIALYTGEDATFSRQAWTGIGIHGTHDPSSIGKNVSEGCIRMHNADLIELYNMLQNQPRIPVDII
jgi:lipoprotein-anchoring transpeptidase ErfK/SrfK